MNAAWPFRDGTQEQGSQSPVDPRDHYRQAMAALGAHCHPATGGVRFADLNDADKDAVIAGLEDGSVDVGEEKGSCFRQLLKDTRQGFVADPLYGGNRDMVGWKMIGFPGVRHDYRDWVDRHYEPYPRAPIGIADHPKWKED